MDVNHVVKFIDRCDRATSKSEIRPIVESFSEAFGFEHYLLRASLRLSGGQNSDIRATNYPDKWLQHYLAEGFGLIDPAAVHSRQRVGAARLDKLLSQATHSKRLSRFADDVEAAGLGQGVTVPLRSAHLSGFLNLHRGKIPSWPSVGQVINLFAVSMSDMLVRLLVEVRGKAEYESLTLREREVIYWALTGKTAWETSIILGITERTIVAHLRNGMETFSCSNKAQFLGRVSLFVENDPALNRIRLEL